MIKTLNTARAINPLAWLAALSIASLTLLNGCALDQKRTSDIQYPATLEINNSTLQVIDIQSIYNSPMARSGFVLDGAQIAPGSLLSRRISQAIYDAIRAGHYVIDGSCADTGQWSIDGSMLEETAVLDKQQQRISLYIRDCTH